MLRSVCSASPITHSVENFIIRTITSRFLLLIRNAKGQCEGIQKRFSRKPLAAPAQDYKTAQPPKPPQNKGWCQGVHNLRKLPDTPRNYPVPVSVVRNFLRLVVHGRTYKNWESNSRLMYEVLHPNAKTTETVKEFFSTYARQVFI